MAKSIPHISKVSKLLALATKIQSNLTVLTKCFNDAKSLKGDGTNDLVNSSIKVLGLMCKSITSTSISKEEISKMSDHEVN